MTSAVHPQTAHDQTHLAAVLRYGAMLGLLQTVLVFAFSLVSRFLEGVPELALGAVIVAGGVAATTVLPGLWTRARTIEGISGAAGLGLFATVVFTLTDSFVLQWIGTYTNRWLEIGGGSNWWYLPIWWMVGTYLPWLGAWALANTAGQGEPATGKVLGISVVLAVLIGAGADLVNFPGAQFGLGTISVAYLPALALTVLLTGMGARRA